MAAILHISNTIDTLILPLLPNPSVDQLSECGGDLHESRMVNATPPKPRPIPTPPSISITSPPKTRSDHSLGYPKPASLDDEEQGEVVEIGTSRYIVWRDTSWPKARKELRDKYCNSKWSQFDQLVGIIPPGGSLGVDDKAFTMSPGPDKHGWARNSIIRFEGGEPVYEFRDLRVNPRCVIESQLMTIKERLESHRKDHGVVSYLTLIFDGDITIRNYVSVAEQILHISVIQHHSPSPTPPPSPPVPTLSISQPDSPTSPPIMRNEETSTASPTNEMESNAKETAQEERAVLFTPPPTASSAESVSSEVSASPATSTATTQSNVVSPTEMSSKAKTPWTSHSVTPLTPLSRAKSEKTFTSTQPPTGLSPSSSVPTDQRSGESGLEDDKGMKKEYRRDSDETIAPTVDSTNLQVANPQTPDSIDIAFIFQQITHSPPGVRSMVLSNENEWQRQMYDQIYVEWKRIKRVIQLDALLPPSPPDLPSLSAATLSTSHRDAQQFASPRYVGSQSSLRTVNMGRNYSPPVRPSPLGQVTTSQAGP